MGPVRYRRRVDRGAVAIESSASDRRSAISSAAIAAAVLIGVMIVLFRQSILPEKFFADGEFIRSIALGTNIAPADHSYLAVGLLYRWLGLAHLPLLASLLGYAAYVAVMLWGARPLRTREASIPELVLLSAALMIGAVYLGWYSKDVLVLPITVVALVRSRSRAVDVGLLVAIAGYALLFRQYWAIVAGTFLVLRLAAAARSRLSTIVVVVPVLAFAVAIVLGVALGVAPDHYRSSANASRDVTDVQSAITPLLPSTALPLQAIDIVLTFLSLLAPIPLLLHGGSYYVLIALALASMWVLLANRARRAFAGDRDPVGERQLALMLGFVVVQALFEPDYGSALRHLTPLLPVAVAYVVGAPAASRSSSDGSAVVTAASFSMR